MKFADCQNPLFAIVYLLGQTGRRLSAAPCDIDAAVILAKTYLTHNHSAARALSESTKLLKQARKSS